MEIEKYQKILAQNGINEEIKDIEVSDSGAKGEGFASVTKRVKIIFKNEEKSPLNLFTKVYSDNAAHGQFLDDIKAFENEAVFFTEYLPEAEKLCAEKGLENLIRLYPKCYFADKTLTVLEDLVTDRGFELLSHRLGFGPATWSLKTLAKHHALSFAMLKEADGEDNFFRRYPSFKHDCFGAMLPLMSSFKDPMATALKILEANSVEGREEALALIQSFAEQKYSDVILNSWKYTDPSEALVLLNHGDYKHNNMMFRVDKETGTILEHVAIDMQVPRYDSPTSDLSYFLFGSVQHSVRQTKIKELLEIYLNELNQVSTLLGHPTNTTFEELWKEYQKKFTFGFLGALLMVGPGQDLMKTMDIDKQDITNVGEFWQQAITKWMEENPDKSVEMAEEIVGLVKEYKTIIG